MKDLFQKTKAEMIRRIKKLDGDAAASGENENAATDHSPNGGGDGEWLSAEEFFKED